MIICVSFGIKAVFQIKEEEKEKRISKSSQPSHLGESLIFEYVINNYLPTLPSKKKKS